MQSLRKRLYKSVTDTL